MSYNYVVTMPFAEVQELLQTIERVRELAEKYEKFGNDLDPRFAPAAVFQGVAKEINKALDGN